MDLAKLEEVIDLAIGNNPQKNAATQMLDSLRAAPDRWTLGLKCFFESGNDYAKLFGLSLIRDFLKSNPILSAEDLSVRRTIRETMMQWCTTAITSGNSIPPYIMNSVVTILTLGIKFEYPVQWPTAFDEILPLAETGPHGVDLVLRILAELEVEVVIFTETRSDEEKRSNTLIKDTMRGSAVIATIVNLLCRHTVSMFHAGHSALAEKCLRCLAELISWIELQLVVQEALQTIYRALSIPDFTGAACGCLYEILKKGMDPVAKVRMVHGIDLITALLTVPSARAAGAAGDGNCRGNGNGSGSNRTGNGSGIGSSSSGSGGGGGGGGTEGAMGTAFGAFWGAASAAGGSSSSARGGNGSQTLQLDGEGTGWVEEYGLVVDMLVLELLGCWGRYEDALQDGAKGKAPDAASLDARDVAPVCASVLHTSLPVLLEIFSHDDTNICATVLPALNKLMSTLRGQLMMTAGLIDSAAASFPGKYFMAAEHVPALLRAVYKQMQYEEDFGFDTADDDDVAVIEAKKEIRKLFVNCCRLFPDACLELICGAFSTLQQPLSRGPFRQVEACLRLAFAFSEGGHGNTKLTQEGPFRELIRALHGTDLAQHPHPQVVMWYLDLSVRHLQVAMDLAPRVAQTMVGPHGLYHGELQVRCKAAQCLLRLVEQMGPDAVVLLSLTGVFAELILNNTQQRSPLSEAAEIQLLEAASLLTSLLPHGPKGWASPGSGVAGVSMATGPAAEAEVQATQTQLLQKMIAVLAHQVSQCLATQAYPSGYSDLTLETLGHKILSIAALAKGHKYKSHPTTSLLFAPPAGLIVTVITQCGSSPLIRSKACVFLHRMVACLGAQVSQLLAHPGCLLHLLQESDASDADTVVQVLSNFIVECKEESLALVDFVLPQVVSKYRVLGEGLDAQAAQGTGLQSQLDTDRASLQRQYLLFIQNVATGSCSDALVSAGNAHLLEHIFKGVLLGLQGGGRGAASGVIGVQMRKSALVILTALVPQWSRPPVAAALTEAFRSFLLQQALPSILLDLTDGQTLNLNDAATHNLLVEVGALLWTVATNFGPQICAEGLAAALSSPPPQSSSGNHAKASGGDGMSMNGLGGPGRGENGSSDGGWPPHAVQTLCQAVLQPGQSVNTFKDQFKRFVRTASQPAN